MTINVDELKQRFFELKEMNQRLIALMNADAFSVITQLNIVEESFGDIDGNQVAIDAAMSYIKGISVMQEQLLTYFIGRSDVLNAGINVGLAFAEAMNDTPSSETIKRKLDS